MAYRSETEEWEKQKDLLVQENNELKDEIDGLKKQLEIYKNNWQIIEDGDDGSSVLFMFQERPYIYQAVQNICHVHIMNAIYSDRDEECQFDTMCHTTKQDN